MSYEDFEKPSSQDEVVRLTNQLHQLIDSALEENYFGLKELEFVQEKMTLVIEQGVFWLKQENPVRFVYDLKEFVGWLCDYIEELEEETKE